MTPEEREEFFTEDAGITEAEILGTSNVVMGAALLIGAVIARRHPKWGYRAIIAWALSNVLYAVFLFREGEKESSDAPGDPVEVEV